MVKKNTNAVEETAEKICGEFIVRDRELLHKFFEDCYEIERRSKE